MRIHITIAAAIMLATGCATKNQVSLHPSQTYEFNGLSIFAGQVHGQELQDIRIHDRRDAELVREIRAKSGRIGETKTGENIVLTLSEVRIQPLSKDEKRAGYFDTWVLEFPKSYMSN